MSHAWLSSDLAFLDASCPLPLDRPFTSAEAERLGVRRSTLKVLVERGLVTQWLHGVYAAAQVVNTIENRAEALRLVVSEHQIVTDRTAAWFHDVDLLPPSALRAPMPIEVFGRDGSRVRRTGVTSGRRAMIHGDVTVIEGIQVTTKVRTALDLGRRLRPPLALAALDALVRAGADKDAMLGGVGRFRGQRGVVQLRSLVGLADGRAESPPESILRWHWMAEGLPEHDLQIWVEDDLGHPRFRIDLGNEELRYGAEYFGARFHGEDRSEPDQARLLWLDRERDWEIDIFIGEDLFGPTADPGPRLRAGVQRARQRRGAWRAQGHFLHL